MRLETNRNCNSLSFDYSRIMKNFKFLLCFLLCVVPCVFTKNRGPDPERIAREIGLTLQDLQECLDKVGADLETIFELNDSVLEEKTTATQEMVKKVGCFAVCVLKKHGIMVNSKILPEKALEFFSDHPKSKEDEEFMRKTFTKCSNYASSKTDECVIAISFNRCILYDVMHRD